MKCKCIIMFVLSLLYVNASKAYSDIYVDPKGSDSNKGTKSSPLYSLTAAKETAMKMPGKDTVYVHINSGRYFITEPIVFTSKDSRPIIFMGKQDNKPIICGGMPITEWQDCGNGVWKTKIKEGVLFEQLYIDGKRAVRARTPNKGWLFVENVKETISKTQKDSAEQVIYPDKKDMEFMYNLDSKDINNKIVAVFYHKWDITRKTITYNHADSTMVIHGTPVKSWNPLTKGTRYILENYKEALDTPGEWFLSSNGELYYMPYDNQDMRKAECYAPVVDKFIVFKGEPSTPIKDKIFRDISFEVSKYIMPKRGNEPMQAAASIEASIEADNAANIVFSDCEVAHTGGYAIWFRSGCQNSKVERCNLYDLGGGGVKIGLPEGYGDKPNSFTSHITLDNNIIQHAGYVFPCAVGVSIFHSADNNVTHNEISNIRYSGVSVGWVWGYAKSESVRNNISFNHIHHIGWGELSDMGAVYTLGISPGTRVCDNVIHDIYSYDYGGWGLYTDEGSTGIVMENNLVYRCKSGGFHQHYGKENIIKNNIFAFGYQYQMQYTRVEAHRSFSFTNNIILQNSGILRSGPWEKGDVIVDSNCYWDMRTKSMEFENKTDLTAWRLTQKRNSADMNSIVADPMFEDPLNIDFRFKTKEVADKIGFKEFDYSKAGVYGSKKWKYKAVLDDDIVKQFDMAVKELSNVK